MARVFTWTFITGVIAVAQHSIFWSNQNVNIFFFIAKDNCEQQNNLMGGTFDRSQNIQVKTMT